jgi:hypothetical protein
MHSKANSPGLRESQVAEEGSFFSEEHSNIAFLEVLKKE